MRLLALDTASGQCSAALFIDGAITSRAVQTARDHARLLLPMIDELLTDSGQTLRALDGIAFGRGPGSFTGLRIAAAVTQGLAAGADRPVLPVSSLRALAAQARRTLEAGASPACATRWLACMDARMGEVCRHRRDGRPAGAAAAGRRASPGRCRGQGLEGISGYCRFIAVAAGTHASRGRATRAGHRKPGRRRSRSWRQLGGCRARAAGLPAQPGDSRPEKPRFRAAVRCP